MLQIRLIGRPGLERDGHPIAGPRGHKTWAVLARLVRATSPVSREQLVTELFSDANDPMGALRWALAELRRRCGNPDEFKGNPVRAELAGTWVDVLHIGGDDFAGHIPEGEFLEGINVRGSPGFESWLLVERQRVDGEVLAALRQATLRAIARRDFGTAVDLARAMVRRAPFDEGPHVLLVKAIAAGGDAAAAARQVEASERSFRGELGVDPTPAIRNAARPAIAAPVPGVSIRASAESLLDAGLAAMSAGAVDAGIECLRRAASDAEASGDPELLSRCLVELGTALVHSIRGYDDEGSVVLEAAVEAAGRAGSQLTAAKAMSELGYVDLLAGRRASATEYLGQAAELSAGDAGLEAVVLGFQAMNLSDWGRPDEAAERFVEALAAARAAGSIRREIWTLGLGSRTLYALGRLGEAADWANQSRALARDSGWTAFRPWPEAWLAHVRLAQGEHPADVRRDAEATFALSRQLQDPCWEGVAAELIGITHASEGDGEQALSWLANAGIWCRRVTDSYTWVQTHILLTEARSAIAFGDPTRAEALTRRAISEAAHGQMDGLLADAVGLLNAL